MFVRSVLVFVLTLSMAAFLCGQTKYTGELKCAKADPLYSIDINDHPGHVYRIGKAICTWIKPFEINGLKAVSEENVYSAEIDRGKSRAQARNIGTMSNGDKYYVRIQSAGAFKDGLLQNSEVQWTWTGAGKLKGISAKGVSQGTGNPDGSSTWLVEGEYTSSK